MTLNALIAELSKLAAAGQGDSEVEIENAADNDQALEISGDFLIEGNVVIIGTNLAEDE